MDWLDHLTLRNIYKNNNAVEGGQTTTKTTPIILFIPVNSIHSETAVKTIPEAKNRGYSGKEG